VSTQKLQEIYESNQTITISPSHWTIRRLTYGYDFHFVSQLPTVAAGLAFLVLPSLLTSKILFLRFSETNVAEIDICWYSNHPPLPRSLPMLIAANRMRNSRAWRGAAPCLKRWCKSKPLIIPPMTEGEIEVGPVSMSQLRSREFGVGNFCRKSNTRQNVTGSSHDTIWTRDAETGAVVGKNPNGHNMAVYAVALLSRWAARHLWFYWQYRSNLACRGGCCS